MIAIANVVQQLSSQIIYQFFTHLHLGGQQAHFTMMPAAAFVKAAANYLSMAFSFLTTEAAHLIEAFGSVELQNKFIPKIYAGEWQGTMALTEPQALRPRHNRKTKGQRVLFDN